jgi:hypothetical protein
MKKIFKLEMREWARGDLVKISTVAYDGASDNAYGLVAKTHVQDKQTKIFPSIDVYNMSTGAVEEYYVYDLELVSPIAT